MVHANGHYVNPDNSHLSLFGSSNTSRVYGLSGATDNSLAANASRIKGGCWFKQKRRTKRRSNTKRRLLKRKGYKKKTYRGGCCSSCMNVQRGGLHSVTHFNNGYSTGGVLPAQQLALANPVPYHQNSYVANPYFPNQRLSY
jgi:hypothetical protein